LENVSFTSNTAGMNGGALLVSENSKVWINQKAGINTEIYGNRAGGYGGAIAVMGAASGISLLTFNLEANSSMRFYDNISSTGSPNQIHNDLYLSNNTSSVVFNVLAGASLSFEGGIIVADGGSTIGKFGAGALNLTGYNYFNDPKSAFSVAGQFNVYNSTFAWITGSNITADISNILVAAGSTVTFTNSSVSFVTNSSLGNQSLINMIEANSLLKFTDSNVLIKDRIYTSDGNGAIFLNVSVSRFYFEGGSLSIINSSAAFGAALYLRAYGPTSITDFSTTTLFLKGNTSQSGAAIFFGRNSSLLNFFNVTKSSFISNVTAGGRGGAIYVTNQSTFNVSQNSELYFISNVSSGIGGGAIHLEANNYSLFRVEDSSMYFSQNIARNTGGAIYVGAFGNFTTNNSYLEFLGNIAQLQQGGAIYVGASGFFTANNSYLELLANTAGAQGGAIYVDASARFSVQNSSL
jgi:predicted outer membrane repeat protein